MAKLTKVEIMEELAALGIAFDEGMSRKELLALYYNREDSGVEFDVDLNEEESRKLHPEWFVEDPFDKRLVEKLGKNFDYAKSLTVELYGESESENYRLIYDTYMDKINWRQAPKRSLVDVIQLNVSSVDANHLTFDSSLAVSIKKFASKREAAAMKAIVRVPVSITRAMEVANRNERDMIIVKMVPFGDDELSPQELLDLKARILREGITDVATARHYLVAVQSAAQARTGSFWFYEAENFSEVDDFRRNCLMLTKEQYDKEFGDKVLMAKMEARVGLAVSNALSMTELCKECREEDFIQVIKSFNVKVIDDVYVSGRLNVVEPVLNADGQFEGMTKFSHGKELELNASDGCGMISVSAVIKCNYGLHLIQHNDYVKAMREWQKYGKSLDNVPEGSWFRGFVLRLSKVLQFRHAGDKGILVMTDMEAHGVEEDILIHESVRKYAFGDWDEAPFEICMYDKPKSGLANMNFQFFQSLNLKPEDIRSLAAGCLDHITDDIMINPHAAMKFLGMARKIGSEEEETTAEIKLNTVLESDPAMLTDLQVQKWLSDKVSKFISDVQIGRIPVEGGFYYIVTDPRYLLSRYLGEELPHLQSGEFYLNGLDCEIAAFRSPLIHASEARKLKCVKVPQLWYYTDLVLFNPYDGTAPAMGGAILYKLAPLAAMPSPHLK